MNNKLEDFIHKNKDSFDEHEPSGALWNRLEKKLEEKQKPVAVLVQANWLKWAAAAVLVLIAGSALFFLMKEPNKQATGIAVSNSAGANNEVAAVTPAQEPGAEVPETEKEPLQRERPARQPVPVKEPDDLSKEMFHYSRLIELKQKEIAIIKGQNPELYNRFLKDLGSLEYSYDALREKQKKGVNNEQLLEAMILNLKMQSGLLNKQLEITKHIKNKNEDEKATGL